MRSFARLWVVSVVLSSFVLVGVGVLVPDAGATPTGTTYYVNAASDFATVNGSGYATDCTSSTNTDCGIDDAIEAFDNDITVGNFDTIAFSPALSTFTVGNPTTITNRTSGVSLRIEGLGSNRTTVSGASATRVFSVQNATVTISGLTIANGSSANGAGVSSSYATLTLSGDTLSNNVASVDGGGVYATYGPIALTNDTFSNNTAAFGGGVFNYDAGRMTMTNDTFSNNSATSGGGAVLNSSSASLTMTNDTLSNNTAASGGGVSNGGGATMTNDTFLNSGVNGGGTIANSILDSPVSCTNGPITDGGYNVESDNSCGFGSTSTVSSNTIGLATSLAAKNSSGPQTLAIGAGSSAFENVPLADCTVTTDERGVTRPGVAGQNCDAGAYERVVDTATLQLSGTPVAGNNTYGVTLTVPSGSSTPSESVVITDSTNNSCSAPLTLSTTTAYIGSCSINGEAASDRVAATYNANLGDLNYAAATSNSLTVQVAPQPVYVPPTTISTTTIPTTTVPTTTVPTSQTITFAALASRHWGSKPFSVAATVSSGLRVSFASETPRVCHASGSRVSILATGTCTIVATQDGQAQFQAATSVARSFRVTPVVPGIPSTRMNSRSMGRLQISLAHPVITGGTNITTYQYSLDGLGWTRISLKSGVFVIANLRPHATYSVRLRALNDVGAGIPSRTVRINIE
ncbi:MAG: choice-of-anchor Q domain-containing protein [Acidimicrobiales bacterium]